MLGSVIYRDWEKQDDRRVQFTELTALLWSSCDTSAVRKKTWNRSSRRVVWIAWPMNSNRRMWHRSTISQDCLSTHRLVKMCKKNWIHVMHNYMERMTSRPSPSRLLVVKFQSAVRPSRHVENWRTIICLMLMLAPSYGTVFQMTLGLHLLHCFDENWKHTFILAAISEHMYSLYVVVLAIVVL